MENVPLFALKKPTLKSEDMHSIDVIAGSFVDETLKKATELVSFAKDKPNKQV